MIGSEADIIADLHASLGSGLVSLGSVAESWPDQKGAYLLLISLAAPLDLRLRNAQTPLPAGMLPVHQ